jgi:hypothetical protein
MVEHCTEQKARHEIGRNRHLTSSCDRPIQGREGKKGHNEDSVKFLVTISYIIVDILLGIYIFVNLSIQAYFVSQNKTYHFPSHHPSLKDYCITVFILDLNNRTLLQICIVPSTPAIRHFSLSLYTLNRHFNLDIGVSIVTIGKS